MERILQGRKSESRKQAVVKECGAGKRGPSGRLRKARAREGCSIGGSDDGVS